jgi:hypothetical protein
MKNEQRGRLLEAASDSRGELAALERLTNLWNTVARILGHVEDSNGFNLSVSAPALELKLADGRAVDGYIGGVEVLQRFLPKLRVHLAQIHDEILEELDQELERIFDIDEEETETRAPRLVRIRAETE